MEAVQRLNAHTLTCPQCFFTAPPRPGMRYCPRCGLPDVEGAAADTSPMDLVVGSRTFRVHDRIAIGSVCSLYRCRFHDGAKEVEGVFKVARDACTNDLVANEADVLRRLRAADDKGRYGPFLPRIEESFAVGGGAGAPGRRANVLRMHDAIGSPDELYSLDEVRGQYPAGLDARDMAWVWRRLLSILGFVHAQGFVHGAVLPMHVLIEPKGHKLLLVDWCCAMHEPQHGRRPVTILNGGHLAWYKRQSATRLPPAFALDVALGARCMIELVGGDPLQGECPPAFDPALKRYFQRCLAGDPDANSANPLVAWKFLDDFDRLTNVLWGRRRFRVFTLPPKRRV